MKDTWIEPVTLIGQRLRLEPLEYKHLESLVEELLTPDAWHFVHSGTRTPEDLKGLIDRGLQWREQKIGQSFAMIDIDSGKAIGMSSFYDINRRYFSLEIGFTWIGKRWQKAFVNTEAKFLMLEYAFETLRCQRVAFKADSLNFNSQRAIARIGAKLEGEVRQYLRLPDGRKRDYKIYSIIDSEWANLKGTLNWYKEKYVQP